MTRELYSDPAPAEASPTGEAESKYLTFLSHELNNNLGGVLMFLELLRREFAQPTLDRAAVGQTLDTAAQAVQDTVSGMRHFLHAERLRQAGKPRDVAPVDLRELASRVARQFAPESTHKAIWVVVDVPPGAAIVSDRELIALVLQNLVGNAVKYSTAGVVRIAARRGCPGGRWILSVTDQGPGIAPDQVAHIFTAFRRGDAHGTSGVGLGLAVAAEAARLIEAEITVESLVGGGSTFRLRFPPHVRH